MLNSTLQAMLTKKYNQFKHKMEESVKVVDAELCSESDAALYAQKRKEETEKMKTFEVSNTFLIDLNRIKALKAQILERDSEQEKCAESEAEKYRKAKNLEASLNRQYRDYTKECKESSKHYQEEEVIVCLIFLTPFSLIRPQ